MLEQFIRINVRAPDQVMGDLRAQLAANRTGEARFIEMAGRFGAATVIQAAKQLQDYSERLTREAITAIPDGIYTAEDFVDDNGFTSDPLRVSVQVTVSGDTLSVAILPAALRRLRHHQLPGRLDDFGRIWRARATSRRRQHPGERRTLPAYPGRTRPPRLVSQSGPTGRGSRSQ